jgi:DNA-binding NtrC family response regulator
MHKPLDMPQVLEIVEGIPASPLVIIVDEEPDFIAVLTAALGAEGIRAMLAEGDAVVVRLVRDESTDLAILDLHALTDGLVDLFKTLRSQGLESPAMKPCDPAAVARLAASMVA